MKVQLTNKTTKSFSPIVLNLEITIETLEELVQLRQVNTGEFDENEAGEILAERIFEEIDLL